MGNDTDGDGRSILLTDHMSAGVGLRRLVGRLVIEPGRARFRPSNGLEELTFNGPVHVTRRWLAPLGANAEVSLGKDPTVGHDEVVLTMGWRAASKVVAALRSAGLEVHERRRLL